MKQRHGDIPLEYICRLLGKTVQTYYYHIRYQKRVAENELVILERVKSIRVHLPGAGVPKLRHMISLDAGLAARCPGRDTMYELLRSHHLLLLRRGRRGPTTTDSRHRYKKYPNLVREQVTNRPNELWVSDISAPRRCNSSCCYCTGWFLTGSCNTAPPNREVGWKGVAKFYRVLTAR